MTCKSFLDLNPVEQVIMVGKVVHLIENYETAFDVVEKMIANADEAGIFDKVKILPENELG